MSSDKFEKVNDLEIGDEVTIHLPGDSSTVVNGAAIENPLETTVEYISKRRLDEKEGHDVDGIVAKKVIHLEITDRDKIHDEYVIITERPMVGENSVSPIEAREYFEGRPGDGKYTIHPIGFEDIEVVD